MSTIIKFDLKELRKLANDNNSCVVEKKVTQNLALQPWCLGNLKDSIKNLLDYKIGKFDKEFNGILLSYKNLRVLQNVGAIRNDNADVHFQVQADYFIFRPHVGAMLKGIVNKKSFTHLGILVHRVFNVVIPRPTEVPDDWIGSTVEEGQEVMFQIVVLDLYGALPYIRGKLDERWLNIEAGDGDDDDAVEIKTSRPINISYVNFDKTKPIKKQINNEMTHSALKKKTSSINMIEKSNCNGQPLNVECENNLPEKIKKKRQSKVPEAEPKQPEIIPRVSKKHKKD
ncbi:DNA-directed RNA polymerase I subunit RPA43 [Pararge aegeria]|uniref:Jg8547 protein n=2 Tax=Pararge aegeria TaxID=116150 RepID=A0A8S4RJM8_9NEOP|nr:DNA-directed RNA polymerase I subunit RPA43 [Pararge aegeria]CAH2236788.1 jg8547 [Pararge aegeria aegeria]